MAGFISDTLELGLPLRRNEFNKKKPWLVRQRLVYITDIEGPLSIIVVPEGFSSDLATIPQFLLSLCPNDYEVAASAVVHDYLIVAEIGEEKWRDAVFKEALECSGVGRFKRTFMHWGVRIIDFF